MLEQPLRVFISSTKRDLVQHRKAVRAALENAGYIPIDMDGFMARDERPVQVCLDEVERSDLLIGIYAWLYGYVPKGAKRSITEREYDHARKLKKTCFCFLLDESHPWPDELRQQEGAESLAAFKAKVSKQMVVCRFTTPEILAIDVLATLQRWKDEHRQAAEPPQRRGDGNRRSQQEEEKSEEPHPAGKPRSSQRGITRIRHS